MGRLSGSLVAGLRGMTVRERIERGFEAWGAVLDDALSFEGKDYRFHDVQVRPRPLQRPHPRFGWRRCWRNRSRKPAGWV